MGQEQRYTNHDDFQVFLSVGWNRWRINFSNSNIKFTFYLSTSFSAHEHRFLSKFNYLDSISVKY